VVHIKLNNYTNVYTSIIQQFFFIKINIIFKLLKNIPALVRL